MPRLPKSHQHVVVRRVENEHFRQQVLAIVATTAWSPCAETSDVAAFARCTAQRLHEVRDCTPQLQQQSV
eukprot:11750685-Alexandrium_andersonii.AAC.1